MSDENWKQVKHLFGELVVLPESQRQDALDRACQGNTDLRRELEALLQQHEDSDDSIRDAVGQMASEALTGVSDSNIDSSFGPWKLRKLLARGGMGAVYLAERADGAFEQQAAVKLINAAVMSAATWR